MATVCLFWLSCIREAQKRFLYCAQVKKYYTKYTRPSQNRHSAAIIPPLLRLVNMVHFKWTLLAIPSKMATAIVDLCTGLVVLHPRQIHPLRRGFFSSAVQDWSLRSCFAWGAFKGYKPAENWRYLRRSFLPRTSSLRCQSRRQSAG